MNCKEANSLFSEYYDKELNEEINSALKKHLDSCSKCRAEYKALKKGVKILKKIKSLEVPQNYFEKIGGDKNQF